jgi:hypothetical protein
LPFPSLAILALAALQLAAGALPAQSIQGMASRGVKPLPRPKPSGLPFHARFTDVAAAAGLTSPVIYGGLDGRDYVLEAMGCGAVFFDYNGDGWLDVFLPSGLRLGETPPGAVSRLYRNNRDGTFTDVTAASGLGRSGWASGATAGDYDNDGDEDLFLTYYGQNVLFRNNGDGTFTDVTRAAGLAGDRALWATGCTFLDYDRDGLLDLFVSRYLDFDFSKTPRKGTAACNWKGLLVHCGPRGLPKAFHSLYRNRGDGTFTDVSAAAGIAGAEPCYGLTAVAADFDGDGWTDIYVACDSNPSLLFVNNKDGSFREEGLLRGAALSDDGIEQAGMGVAVGDYDLDGRLDILKTHFSGDTSTLYRNLGRGHFEDMTLSAGLGVETRFVSWGAGIEDFDRDGQPDLFWVTGDVYPELEKRYPHLRLRTPPVLFRNLGGGRFEQLFEEAGPALAAAHCSRGAAFGDYDNDGDVDILVVNLNEPPSLLRNDTAGAGHWLEVKLEGVRSNRSAIGALVTAVYGGRRQVRAVTAQSSYLSVSDRRLHFGLGQAGTVSLEVRWPSGTTEKFENIPADRLVTIREGAGVAGDQ